MKKILFSVFILMLPFSFNCFAQSKQKTTKQKITTKEEVKEVKLTSEQRVEKIAKYIELNEKEKAQILVVFKNAKVEKEKIKAADYTKKVEKEKTKIVKAAQKEKLKKILGQPRFNKYEKLKDKDIL